MVVALGFGRPTIIRALLTQRRGEFRADKKTAVRPSPAHNWIRAAEEEEEEEEEEDCASEHHKSGNRLQLFARRPSGESSSIL